MNKAAVMRELKSVGSAQTLKTYARHGISGPAFGVKYADLYRLQKKIKADQALAEQLWDTKNHDARVLATLIADPRECSAKLLDRWTASLTNHTLSFAISTVAARCPKARAHAGRWVRAKKNEWRAAAGWDVLTVLVGDGSRLDDDDVAALLAEIESRIHGSPNRVRYGMNNTLIAIGGRSDAWQAKALAVARRIGKVEVDHGATSCKTPDARDKILKAAARRAAKGKKKKAPAKKRAPAKKKAPAKTGGADFDGVVGLFSDEVRAIARALRKVIRKCTKAEEVPYLGYKSINYTFQGRKGTVCSLGLHATRVNLQFPRGTELKDPDGLLEGTGKTMRHVKLDGTQAARGKAVAALIKAADRLARAALA
jgi:3-methyladenine DNA glycosylase AlkD